MKIMRWLLVMGVVGVFALGWLCARFFTKSGDTQFSPARERMVVKSSSAHWQLRSRHLPFGVPVLVDDRYSSLPNSAVPGVSVLVREGFVIGHFDRGKIPLWMSMRWTKEDLLLSLEAKERRRQFHADDELPKGARGAADYGNSELDRGHLARNKDNTAWGEDNARMGDLMSNVVPQPVNLNRGPWLELEKVVSSAPEKRVALSDTFWVVAGSIFDNGTVRETIGNGTAVPDAFFKIVTWMDRNGKLQAMAFIFPKDVTNRNPTAYLSSIDEIESRTGIDFFSALEPEVEKKVEAFVAKRIWETSQ